MFTGTPQRCWLLSLLLHSSPGRRLTALLADIVLGPEDSTEYVSVTRTPSDA